MNPLITPDQAVAIALAFSRVIAFFMAFPVLNIGIIPLNIRILLVVAFSLTVILHYNLSLPVNKIDLVVFVLLIIKEILLGLSLGLISSIFIAIFMYASEIISYFIGFTIVNIFNPAFGQTSVLSTFFLLLFYLLFFITGSYQILIGSLFKSFEIIPIYSLSFDTDILTFILKKSADIFKIGLQVAFPFALLLVVFNVVMALINRLIPQINVFFIGLPAQILIGLLALMFGSAVIVKVGVSLIDQMTHTLLDGLKILSR